MRTVPLHVQNCKRVFDDSSFLCKNYMIYIYIISYILIVYVFLTEEEIQMNMGITPVGNE
jgi:hypothetical protein